MQCSGGGRWPWPAVGRLVLCVLVVGVVMGGQPRQARAVGFVTHAMVAAVASGGTYSPRYPDLATLLETYPGAVASGAAFPDWGYSIDVLHDDPFEKYGKVAHENGDCDPAAALSYREAFAAYLHSHLSPPYSEDDLKSIAFLYGLTSHVASDRTFDTYFIPQAQAHWADSWGAWDPRRLLGVPGHPEVDMGVDSFNHLPSLILGIDWFEEWFFPVQGLAAAYAAVGCHEISEGTLTWALDEFTRKVGSALDAEAVAGLPYYDWRLEWALNNLETAEGGTNDLYEATATAWQQRWDTWKPVTTVRLSPAAPDGKDGAYEQPVGIHLTATAYLNGEIETWYSVDGGVYQRYSGPFAIATRGTHDIAYYSVQSLPNAAGAAAFTITGDAASLSVKIALPEEPCPTGPVLAAPCDRQPPPYYIVVNGQQACLDRDGGSCSPFVLAHPECTDCATCNVDVEAKVCKPLLAGKVPGGQTETVYEMCQSGSRWISRVRALDSLGNCPASGGTVSEPPDTGVPLPAPAVAGGLAILGAICLATGWVLRRRTP